MVQDSIPAGTFYNCGAKLITWSAALKQSEVL